MNLVIWDTWWHTNYTAAKYIIDGGHWRASMQTTKTHLGGVNNISVAGDVGFL